MAVYNIGSLATVYMFTSHFITIVYAFTISTILLTIHLHAPIDTYLIIVFKKISFPVNVHIIVCFIIET